ncbi:MAG: hypothetical protein AAGI66_08460 [Cyanobacteria bacterium P01_H01_bin.74]
MISKEPHHSAKLFFQLLVKNQCIQAWDLFSAASQKKFISWTLANLYKVNNKAATAAKLGTAEVKLMFETNNLDLVISFWRHFVRKSGAAEFARFAYFETQEKKGHKSIVEAKLVFSNGQERRIRLVFLFERGNWRFGYIESKLPFD